MSCVSTQKIVTERAKKKSDTFIYQNSFDVKEKEDVTEEWKRGMLID
jgi:hypothetical protein